MESDLERALRGLHDAAVFARSYQFELTDGYLALIAEVESLPGNQSGAAKDARAIGNAAAWATRQARARRIK